MSNMFLQTMNCTQCLLRCLKSNHIGQAIHRNGIFNQNFLLIRTVATAALASTEQIEEGQVRKRKGYIADKIRLYVRGGSGGQGCPSVGGMGGKGGSVFVKCAKGASLTTYTLPGNKRIIAGHGGNSTKKQPKGIRGRDINVLVPPGTIVTSEKGCTIADLDKDGSTAKVASGGHGGAAKNDFNGEKGERLNLTLELKVIADVALVGFPNAGKSTLLRALSNAKPKVGSYPFTTINPMVGSIFYPLGRKVTVADLPGLIEDAHVNKGMGHRFLRHVERTKQLMLVVDVNGFQLKENQPVRSPFDAIVLLLRELALYKEDLLTRQILLVLNKMDAVDAYSTRDKLLQQLHDCDLNHDLIPEDTLFDDIKRICSDFVKDDFSDVLSVSAKTGERIDSVKEKLHKVIAFDEFE